MEVKKYSACMIRRKLQGGFRIVTDVWQKKGLMQNKHPGGMTEPVDLDINSWINEIEKLAKEAGFQDHEIDAILNFELIYDRKHGRSVAEHTAIRKVLAKTGIYVPELVLSYSQYVPSKREESNPVEQNFYFALRYMDPSRQMPFRCKDPDVYGSSWISAEELFCDESQLDAQRIIPTHLEATKKIFEQEKFSEKTDKLHLTYAAMHL